jgi:hypothetical protein
MSRKMPFKQGDLVWLNEKTVALANMGEGFPLAGRVLWVSKGRCNVYVCGECREVLTDPSQLDVFTPQSLVDGYNFGKYEFRAWKASVSDLLHHVSRFRKPFYASIPDDILKLFVISTAGKRKLAGLTAGASKRFCNSNVRKIDLSFLSNPDTNVAPRRSRRQAEELGTVRPAFSSVLETLIDGASAEITEQFPIDSDAAYSSPLKPGRRVTGPIEHKADGRRVKDLSKKKKAHAKGQPRTPSRALCGIEGADAVASLLEFDMNDEQGWLSGALMDYVFCTFAKKYHKTVFLPTMFAAHDLQRAHAENKLDQLKLTDVLGNKVNPRKVRHIVFCFNVMNRHWNVVQIILRPYPELQLYEPMGKPSRHARRPDGQSGVSARNLPRCTYNWLESMWPMQSLLLSIKAIGSAKASAARDSKLDLVKAQEICDPEPKDWPSVSTSAITSAHQLTSFDCGVACLLYTEKLASGQDRASIDRWTDQSEITRYRNMLVDMMANTVLKKRHAPASE